MHAVSKHHRIDFIALIAILMIMLFGGWIRYHEATRDVRLHSDEALYSTYARNAAVYGYWMLNGPLDKPPLSIYASALGMHFFAANVNDLGVIDVPIIQGEFAAKIPNVFAGWVTIALSYTIAHTLYRKRRVTLIAALVVAVSPYAVAYSASAFTDALMLVLMLTAWLLAIRQRPAWSGMMLALSFAAKPQGLLYLPLIFLFLVIDLHELRLNRVHFQRGAIRRVLTFTLALLAGIGVLVLWDASRPETSLFTLGSINISQGRFFTPSAEWLPRLREWLRIGDNLLGWGWYTALLIMMSAVVVFWRKRVLDWALLVFAVGFFLLHWIAAFWTFDRYLLPLVPIFALLVARAITWIARKQAYPQIVTYLCVGSLILFGTPARHDPRADAYHGETQSALIDVSTYFNQLPLGAIIYDRWMGWELGYYIGAWSDKRRVYYPDPENQAQDALLNHDPAPRYLLAPANHDSEAWLRSFFEVGFGVCLAYSQDGFAAYRLTPPAGVGLADSLPGIPQVWDDATFESSWHDPAWCDDATES